MFRENMFRNENIKRNILLLKNKEDKFSKYIMNDICTLVEFVE